MQDRIIKLYKFRLICFLSGLLLIFSFEYSNAQDFTLSQWYNNQLYFNPAYTGLNPGLRAKLNYRRQWAKIPGDFHTYNFSVDIADRDLPGAGGLGFIINSNKQGIGYLESFTVGIMPAVRIPLAENFVMQAAPLIALVRQQPNWDNLIFEGQLDDINGNMYPSSFTAPNAESITYPDFGFGLVFQVKGENVVGTFGAAGHHLTRPSQSFFEVSAPLERKFVAHGDIVFEMREYKGYFKRRINFKLNPGLIYQNQHGLHLFSIGMNLYISNVYAGMWYRNESLEYDTYSDIILMAGVMVPFKEDTRIKIMYSYDLRVTAHHAFTGPSHEISMIFEFDKLKIINTKKKYSSFRGRKIIEETLECHPF